MANGNNQVQEDTHTRVGVLSQRTANLESGFVDFRREVNQQFTSVNASVSSLLTKMDERFTTLNTSIAERSRPQWQALGVMVSVVVVLGGLVYWPIRESTNDLKAQDIETSRLIQSLTSETSKAIQSLAANTVTRQEMDWRAQRGIEDRNRMEAAVVELRTSTVDRNEWMERNRAYDQQAADFNRRLDELRQDFGSVYGTRDVIQDMKRELDDLRRKTLAGS
ncbi:hypothetical protein [Mesorhizobium ciceri]|uniref:hypothetical protein n=1 Tax=Mesorhizobium ciceri TaxID=39645 RepID=UPI001AEBAF1C|nr:hypothetical protein [Mesorhizobium ciceri]